MDKYEICVLLDVGEQEDVEDFVDKILDVLTGTNASASYIKIHNLRDWEKSGV